jgi:hypothetical protein
MSRRAILIALATFVTLVAQTAAQPAPPTPLGPNFDPTTFAGQLKVTTFASGLNYPTSMQSYNGGILVGTTNGVFSTGAAGSGHLLLLTDTNHDGVADQTLDLTPAGGLLGEITSVRQAGNLLFVTSSGNINTPTPTIAVLKQGATPTSPFVSLGQINLNFPTVGGTAWEHGSFALAVRPNPTQSGNYDVLFNLGSRTNQTSDETSPGSGVYNQHVTASTSGANVSGFSGLSLNPESIYMTTVAFNGTTASLTTPAQVAHGLRNAAGITFQLGTGDLYYIDNGMDGSTANGHPSDKYGNAAYSLDTLHKISAANVGITYANTNFATDFYENTVSTFPQHGNPDAIARFAPFGPFNASDHNSSVNESEGPNEIAFSPANFPAALQGIFIGFHGQFDKAGPPNTTTGAGNEEHPVVFYNTTTGQYWHFIGNQEPLIGHLDGMLSTSDGLYMSDLADGSLFGAPTNTGAIYLVSAVPEPSTLASTVAGLAAVISRRQRRRRAAGPNRVSPH